MDVNTTVETFNREPQSLIPVQDNSDRSVWAVAKRTAACGVGAVFEAE